MAVVDTNDLITKCIQAHQIQTTSSSRGGIVHRRAGCTCDPAIEFDWYKRDEEFNTHLHHAIFEAGRAQGISDAGQTSDRVAAQQ